MDAFPEKWSGLRVVLVHDWLTGMRGGERVLELLCRAFPTAPIMTLFHEPSRISPVINSHPVTTSLLQAMPGIFRHYRSLLPVFPLAIRSLRTPPCDLVISTSHCVAKGIRPPAGARHLCYCFTPMRYAWLFFDEYLGGHPLKSAVARPVLGALRRWDRAVSSRVNRFVAISEHVQKRIGRFYGREADVVYPPVDTETWTPGPAASGNYDLIVSALVPYKRIDLAIRAYNAMGLPLRIVGAGSELDCLRKQARPNIEFLGWQDDVRLLELYRSSRFLVFPGEEDFGIVPLEAQACGKPVIAYAVGGALETIRPGETGVFFDAQSEAALIDAVRKAEGTRWNPGIIRANAERFGPAQFVNGLAASIDRCLNQARAG